MKRRSVVDVGLAEKGLQWLFVVLLMGVFPTITMIRSEKESRANIQALIWNKIFYNDWFRFFSCYLKIIWNLWHNFSSLKMPQLSLQTFCFPACANEHIPSVSVRMFWRYWLGISQTWHISASMWREDWNEPEHTWFAHHTEQEKKKRFWGKMIVKMFESSDWLSLLDSDPDVTWTGCFFGVCIHSFKFSHDS